MTATSSEGKEEVQMNDIKSEVEKGNKAQSYLSCPASAQLAKCLGNIGSDDLQPEKRAMSVLPPVTEVSSDAIPGAIVESSSPVLLPKAVSPEVPSQASADASPHENNGNVISTDFKDPTANVLANVMSVEDLRERVTLGWKNIDVFVPLPRASICRRICCREANQEPQIKQILSNVNGVLEPGTLLAVMGASGAGKTSLMNVLAHRNIANVQVSGSVTVNKQPIGLGINSMSAYIQQEDLFIGTLTVREHLTFNALLRMDRHVPKADRLKRVDEVLLELGLKKCADTVIGIPGRTRGISGGEKKRLSFASEILNDPPLLFADEPTSGLDAFMAQSVVASLQRLASKGRTIMCTIHQPSSEVYAMFNSILLMAEGRVAYMGPTDKALEHFSRLGYSCPTNFNPADYFVHTLAIIPGEEEKCQDRVRDVCNHYSEMEREKEREKEADKRKLSRQDSFKNDAYIVRQSPYRATWFTQFFAVLWRCWVSNSREVLVTRVRLFQNVVVGLIAGLIYLNTGFVDDTISNIFGALFFMTTQLSFSSLQGVLFTFPIELPVFLREHKNGMYRTDVYFISKTLAELPIFVVSPLLMVVVSYWMIDLRSGFVNFIVCFGILVLITNVAVSFGYVISTLAPTVQAATSLGPPIMLPLLIFGGFFLKNTTVPDYFIWLKFISWFKYGFEALIINQFKGNTITCSAPHNSTIGPPCITSGDVYIKNFGFDEDNMMIDIYAMLALFIGFRIVSFLFLLLKAYKRQ